MWFATLFSMVSTLVPRFCIAARAAIEMSEATSAYSIALAPFSHLKILINRFIAHSWLTPHKAETAVLASLSSGEAAKSLCTVVNGARPVCS